MIDPSDVITNTISGTTFQLEVPEDLIPYKEFQKRLPATMRKIGREAKSFWKSEAGRRLKSSRIKYQEAIDFHQEENTVEIYLEDAFATKVELGYGRFDMKPGLLRNAPNPKIRIPKAVADSRIRRPHPTKWRIVPLNVRRYVNGTPSTYRTVTDVQPAGMWQHPGYKGVKIMPLVQAELEQNIIPKHLNALIDSVFNKNK